LLHGREERQDDNDDILRAGPRCVERQVGGGIVYNRRQRRRFFFARFFIMKTLTDELLGIKQDKFKVGDLVTTTASTSLEHDKPWLGVVTTVTVLKNDQGKKRNLYTVDWIDVEAKQILWYDWYDEDLCLVQQSADC